MLPMQKTICYERILVIGDMIDCVLAEKSGTQSVRQKNFKNWTYPTTKHNEESKINSFFLHDVIKQRPQIPEIDLNHQSDQHRKSVVFHITGLLKDFCFQYILIVIDPSRLGDVLRHSRFLETAQCCVWIHQLILYDILRIWWVAALSSVRILVIIWRKTQVYNQW